MSEDDRPASLQEAKSLVHAVLVTRAIREDGLDADNTPHTFNAAAPDTCRHCGNGADHPVHEAYRQVAEEKLWD